MEDEDTAKKRKYWRVDCQSASKGKNRNLLTLKVTIIKQRYLKWIFLRFILKNESFEIFA